MNVNITKNAERNGIDPVVLVKTLKAFTRIGSQGAIEFRITKNEETGGIDWKKPIHVVNIQNVLGRVAYETAIVLPLSRRTP